jgi:hypothetical protein
MERAYFVRLACLLLVAALLTSLPFASGQIRLNPLSGPPTPVNNKSVAVFKTTPQGDQEIEYGPTGDDLFGRASLL